MARRIQSARRRSEFTQRLRIVLGDRTQTWLAGELGVERSTVSHWLSGRREPNLTKLRELSMVLGITTDALLGLPEVSSPLTITCQTCGRQVMDPFRRVEMRLIVDYAGSLLPRAVQVVSVDLLGPEGSKEETPALVRLEAPDSERGTH